MHQNNRRLFSQVGTLSSGALIGDNGQLPAAIGTISVFPLGQTAFSVQFA